VNYGPTKVAHVVKRNSTVKMNFYAEINCSSNFRNAVLVIAMRKFILSCLCKQLDVRLNSYSFVNAWSKRKAGGFISKSFAQDHLKARLSTALGKDEWTDRKMDKRD
jgi:hypothetical protein